ncbi:MAG TPA: MMPL family transporter [Oscillospiraceae bacterium]|nr:MMPL family transporter [Oscillospiraceae bacterium]
MLEKISYFVTHKPGLVLIIAALLVLPSAIGTAATRINYDVLSYIPDTCESKEGESLLEEPFHMAATVMIVVEDMPSGYVSDLQKSIEEVPGVSSAVSLAGIAGAQFPTEMLPSDLTDLLDSGGASLLVAFLDEPGASEDTMNAIAQIKKLCGKTCFLAGFSVLIQDTKELVDQELPVYISVACVLSLAAMCLMMESWVLPVAIMGCIALAVLYNMGTNVMFGEISYLTKAIAAVLQLAVTMDYSVFLYNRYREERGRYDDRREAMAAAMKGSFSALMGSSLTTIAGFAALCFMQLGIGLDIGLVMIKGVAVGILCVVFILPAMLLLLEKPIEKYRHRSINPDTTRMNRFLVRHRGVFAGILLVLYLPACFAQKNTNIVYDLMETMPDTLPSMVGTQKLKDDFGMVTSHYVILRDDLTGEESEELLDRLEDVKGVDSVLAYRSVVPSSVPDFFVPDDLRDKFEQDGRQIIMINSIYDNATDEIGEQLDAIDGIVKSYDAEACITGSPALSEDLIGISSVDFRVTGYISIIAVLLIIAIVFQSASIPAILVAVIEFAIFFNEGIPYFSDEAVMFVTPTVISCVQLGATVDYSILLASRYREELRKGQNRFDAMITAASASDHSIATSALVMFCATGTVAMVSEIKLVSSICAMLARGALVSAAVCMFLLPPLLCLLEPLIQKTSLQWPGGGKTPSAGKRRLFKHTKAEKALPENTEIQQNKALSENTEIQQETSLSGSTEAQPEKTLTEEVSL